MGGIRFILIGAGVGIAWATSLRGLMMVLADSQSTFTFTGTFGIIIRPACQSAPCSAWLSISTGSGISTRY